MLAGKAKPLDPGLRRDDVCYLGDRKIPTVIPAEAGIQWLSLHIP
jgi:hypothetical protein